MKKLNIPGDDSELLAGSLMGEVNELTPAQVQNELAKLELEKLQEERDEIRTKRSIKKKQQEYVAREAQKKRNEEIRIQNGCSHKKQNGDSAVAAMYNHMQVLMGVCQNCGKEWIDNNIPQDLLPSYEAIGGPGVR